MEYRLGSNENIAAPKLSSKRRENISAKVREKHSNLMVPEEINTAENKPTPVPPPIFCLSCNSKTVVHKNSVCPTCAEKLRNQAWFFIPPSFVIGLSILIGFGMLLLVSWWIKN